MILQARHRNIAAISFGITGIVAAIYGWKGAYKHDALLLAELRAKNELTVRGRKVAVDTNLVFLGITQPSYGDLIGPEDIAAEPILAELTNSFPWSRSVWAAAIDKLAGAGAKVIVIDLLFPAPGTGDADLRRALDRHAHRVVIAANAISRNSAAGRSASILYPHDSVLNYSDSMAPWADGRVGFVNYVADADDVIRRATFRIGPEGGLPPNGELESLVARALRKAGDHALVPPDRAPHLFRFTAGPGDGYPLFRSTNCFCHPSGQTTFAAVRHFATKSSSSGRRRIFSTTNIERHFQALPCWDLRFISMSWRQRSLASSSAKHRTRLI